MITYAKQEDIKDIANLYITNWKETYQGLLPAAFLESMDLEYGMNKWATFLNDGHTLFIAKENNKLLGFAACMKEDNETYYLDSLHVSKESRGKGIGRKLIQTVKNYALYHHCNTLTISIIQGNDYARNLYTSLGAKHLKYFHDNFKGTISNSEKLVFDLTKDMKIIRCQKEDTDKLDIFYKEVVDYLMTHINYPLWDYDYPNRTFVEEKIEKHELFACMKAGKVVGAFVLNNDPAGSYEKGNWKQLHVGEYEVIHTFAVHPSFYKQGIASTMLDYCLFHAYEHGYQALRVDIVPTNTPAISLYASKGMKDAGLVDLDRHIDRIPLFLLYGIDF